MKHVGQRIKQLREQAKMTQTELGDITGVTAPAICNYEKGVNRPSYEVLKAIKETFACSYDWLLEDL